MKKFAIVLFVALMLALFVFPVVRVGVVSAAPETLRSAQSDMPQDAQPLDLTGLLQSAFQFVMGSAVIAAAATFLVNTGKSAGLVNDTQSLTWVSALNFVLIVGVFLVKLFAPTFDLGVVEKVADGIARQGPGFILPLMPLLVAFSKWFHGAVRGVKIFGTSFSLSTK